MPYAEKWAQPSVPGRPFQKFKRGPIAEPGAAFTVNERPGKRHRLRRSVLALMVRRAQGRLAVGDERAPGSVDRKLGERVRARRLALDMSQEQLADLLGVTFQQVQKYERGVNRIAASRLLDIASALEMPVARFFEGLGPRGGARTRLRTEDLLAKPGVAELVRLFAAIEDKKLRQRVVDLVRTMADSKA